MSRTRQPGPDSVAIQRWPVAAVVVAAGMSGSLAWLAVSSDHPEDFATAMSGLPWTATAAVGLVAMLGVIHFVAAAFALRAVSNGQVGIRATAWAQLAAASVNRIVPAGIGALGINLRYLVRSGLAPGAATSALAALALVGGGTDALYVAAVTGLGPRLGVGGATGELHTLSTAGLAAGHRHTSLIVVAAAVVLLVVALRRRGRPLPQVRSALVQAATHVRSLFSKPRQLAAASVASLATTAVLSVAFVLAIRTWGVGAHALPVGALIALYWVATAAGTATPLPAFFGVTEAALISGLVVGGYSAASATVAVLIFRGVTFWLPVPLGAWAARTLRRAQLL